MEMIFFRVDGSQVNWGTAAEKRSIRYSKNAKKFNTSYTRQTWKSIGNSLISNSKNVANKLIIVCFVSIYVCLKDLNRHRH